MRNHTLSRLRHGAEVLFPAAALLLSFFACTGSQELIPEPASQPAARTVSTGSVVMTQESIHSPLGNSVGAPPQCDDIHYLRFRSGTESGMPSAAHAVLVMIPGYIGGAGSFGYFARELVALAGTQYPVEVWAVERRSNCLEDQAGLELAENTKNPQAAVDYYYKGFEISGRTFAGFYEPGQTAFLSEFGLQLLMQDIHTIITEKLPDPADRKKAVFLAGHSMGAAFAADFAVWDFDNDSATLADAGFNNCAGLIGLEGRAAIWSSAMDQRQYERRLARLRSRPGEPFITPEAMTLIEILALYAAFEPDHESTLFSRIAVAPQTARLIRYFTTYPPASGPVGQALSDFHLSNEAMLGLFSDDNFQPVSIGRVSLGFLAGGPILRRGIGNAGLFKPASTGAFYTWANFDTTGSAADPAFTDTTGMALLTDAESEVTDLQDYAHAVFEGPLNFYEWYFPGRLTLDLGIVAAPYRADYGIATLHLDRINSLPAIDFLAQDIAGYDHLDVLCASADRLGRRKNEVLEGLLTFLLEHSGGPVYIP